MLDQAIVVSQNVRAFTLMRMASSCQNFNCQDGRGLYIVLTSDGMFTIKDQKSCRKSRGYPIEEKPGSLLTQHITCTHNSTTPQALWIPSRPSKGPFSMKIPLNSRMLERIASLAVGWDGLITSRTAKHKMGERLQIMLLCCFNKRKKEKAMI